MKVIKRFSSYIVNIDRHFLYELNQPPCLCPRAVLTSPDPQTRRSSGMSVLFMKQGIESTLLKLKYYLFTFTNSEQLDSCSMFIARHVLDTQTVWLDSVSQAGCSVTSEETGPIQLYILKLHHFELTKQLFLYNCIQ